MSKEMNDKHSERLRRAEEQYQAMISEAGLILVAGMIVVIWICVVLF